MKEIIKKYWFVGTVGVILVASIAYFAYDTKKDVIPGKTIDGENVVYSLTNKDVKASEFYDSLYTSMGVSSIGQRFQFLVVDQVIETTDEMTQNAKAQADQLIAQYKSAYGADYEKVLLAILNSIGYSELSGLESYLVSIQKYNLMITESADELFPTFSEEYKPRVISHILVKMADPENPTEEELARFEEVKQALADGKSFEEVATTYSDDTSSAVNKGSIGYTDKTSSLVPEFLEASLQLEVGQTSDWVKTQYGYHLIRCDATDLETLKTYEDFTNAIHEANPEYLATKLFENAEKLGVEYGSEELEAALKKLFGLGGQE